MEKNLFNAMLSKIQNEILKNREEIKNVNKIDMKYCSININENQLIRIIESYKNREIVCKKNKLFIYSSGDPYVVLNLIMISICANINLTINIDEIMLGVNKCILEIINNILRNNNRLAIEITNKKCLDDVIFIDRVNDYNILNKSCKKARFIANQGIDIFCDSEKYDEILSEVYEYAISMNIDVDIFDEEEGMETLLKYGKANKVLVLSNKKVNIKDTNKKIYINENPFKDEKNIFEEDFIRNILS